MKRSWPPRVWVPWVVWMLGAFYAATHIRLGWIPHDEGTLAQSAERLLNGELPHRDFHDVYTGGLTYLHAGVFRLAGINLMNLRISLFVFFLAWIPAVYMIARRFAAPMTAGALVLAAVVWSIPSYFAALPSWYNLFFATFSTAALLRFLETGRRRWAFLAGVCAGVSILFKVVGLYQVAAGLLFFAFREQILSSQNEGPPTRRLSPYALLLSAASILLLVLVLGLLGDRAFLREIVHFVVPIIALLCLLLWNERQVPDVALSERLRHLFLPVVPFLVGVVAPVVVFLVPFLVEGALSDLVQGVLVKPMLRYDFAVLSPPNALFSMLGGVALVGFLVHPRWRVRRPIEELALVVILGVVLASTVDVQLTYLAVWYSVSGLVSVTAIVGAAMLARRGGTIPGESRQLVFLLLAVAVMFNLLRFPFASAGYFVYGAPLVLLAVAALVSVIEREASIAPATALAFFVIFGVLALNPAHQGPIGDHYRPIAQPEPLGLPRAGGIMVERVDRLKYESLVATIGEHSSSDYIFCSPDCPEVYFLSGLRNPTPVLWDFFDASAGRTSRVTSALERRDVNVVVINSTPGVSPPIANELAAELTSRFPNASVIGNFTVRWR